MTTWADTGFDFQKRRSAGRRRPRSSSSLAAAIMCFPPLGRSCGTPAFTHRRRYGRDRRSAENEGRDDFPRSSESKRRRTIFLHASQYRATLPQQQRRLRSQILGCRAVNDRRSRRRVEDVPIVRVFLPKSRPPSSNGLRLRPSPAVMTLKSGFQMVAGARFVQARTTELRKFWVGLAIIDARLEKMDFRFRRKSGLAADITAGRLYRSSLNCGSSGRMSADPGEADLILEPGGKRVVGVGQLKSDADRGARRIEHLIDDGHDRRVLATDLRRRPGSL
jgi:hypothetical protein